MTRVPGAGAPGAPTSAEGVEGGGEVLAGEHASMRGAKPINNARRGMAAHLTPTLVLVCATLDSKPRSGLRPGIEAALAAGRGADVVDPDQAAS